MRTTTRAPPRSRPSSSSRTSRARTAAASPRPLSSSSCVSLHLSHTQSITDFRPTGEPHANAHQPAAQPVRVQHSTRALVPVASVAPHPRRRAHRRPSQGAHRLDRPQRRPVRPWQPAVDDRQPDAAVRDPRCERRRGAAGRSVLEARRWAREGVWDRAGREWVGRQRQGSAVLSREKERG